MFVVLLKFSDNKARASELMDAHNTWIDQAFSDGTFLLVGSLQPGLGGAILAQAESQEALQQRVEQDPFVVENVVNAEILEISPARAEPRLEFLLA